VLSGGLSRLQSYVTSRIKLTLATKCVVVYLCERLPWLTTVVFVCKAGQVEGGKVEHTGMGFKLLCGCAWVTYNGTVICIEGRTSILFSTGMEMNKEREGQRKGSGEGEGQKKLLYWVVAESPCWLRRELGLHRRAGLSGLEDRQSLNRLGFISTTAPTRK
jgi:hypothetical protein